MTTETLTGRALDARVAAVVLNWSVADLSYVRTVDGDYYHPDRDGEGGLPAYSTDPAAARLVEDAIERRGLVERYQDALIEVLGLDMQVFNSAIELDPHGPQPTVPGNTFEWDGHAYLWVFSHATPAQRCRAALIACGVTL